MDNLFYLGAGDDTVNPGLGVDTVDGGAGFDKLSADFGNETQAITFIGGDTTADIANPTDAFHELFAPEFTIDADTTHDAWHHDAAPAPFDFDVMDAMV